MPSAPSDAEALAILNAHFAEYEISSVERADLAELFGNRRCAAAAANLAKSVDAASLDLGWAAHQSLCQLFPDAAREFKTPEEAADYWIAYVETTTNRATDEAGEHRHP